MNVRRLDGVLQHYDWGDPRAIADLQGREPSGRPEAELWLGAHPSAPSLVADGRSLEAVIADDPAGALGPAIVDRFGELPFLLKLLAAAEPLSIQAHPSADQAEAGHAAENDRGVPVDAPERVYRDRNHKPELICALAPFRALCGFRRLDATRELFAALGPGTEPVVERLSVSGPDAEVLAATLDYLLTEADSDVVRGVVEAARVLDRPGWHDEAQVVLDAQTHHPDDPGIVVTLLLNYVELEPTEALFLGSGNLHAYLSGFGVEVMANSDNVVRGGLTSKHVDVVELLQVVDCTPIEPRIQRPDDWNHRYDVDADEFVLHRYVLAEGRAITWEREAPAIALVTRGSATVDGEPVGRGGAVFLAASETARLTGDAEVYLATTPHAP